MLLILVVFITLSISGFKGCIPTPTNVATPEIMILPCTTCPTLPLLDPPGLGGGGGFVAGMISQVIDTVGPGCLRFTVTCEKVPGNNNLISMGGTRNGMNIVIAVLVNGPIVATIICNGDAMFEGVDQNGDRVLFDSIYCSQVM